MPVTREEIVAKALALLDEAGLAGLTLRRLAERLDVRAPSLYWHVQSKRELLDLVAAAIVGDALADWRAPRPGQQWWDWLAERSRALRTGLLAHRDGALVLAGNRPTAADLPHIERQLTILVEAGFPPPEALLAVLSLNTFVLGDVLETQRDGERRGAAAAPPARRAITGGAFPVLAEAKAAFADPDRRFEHGLALLIEGLRGRLGRVPAGRTG